MKTLIALLICSVLGTALTAGASEGDGAPHIVDVAGDANFIMFPVHSGGMIGYLIEELFGNSDPLGGGTSTAPASLDQADLREVTFGTTYREVLVGEDGIDYQATGLKIHIRTSAVPTETLPLRYSLKAFLIPSTGQPCRSEMEGYVGNHPEPYSQASGTLTWRPVGDFGSTCVAERDSLTDPRWTATITPALPGIVLSIPYDSLTEAERPFLEEGVVLDRPKAYTATYTLGGWIDGTPQGEEFTIGQDMPRDVPCTKGCPGG